MRLWIDTDLGDDPDDAVALLAACAHPGIEVVGVSTVGGDVVTRAEHVTALLRGVGAPVPLVYAGSPDPRAVAVAEAVLAIGPLTNVAGLLRAGVELPPTAVMGGVLAPTWHRGAERTVDSNFAADPVAAAVVVAHAPDLLIVPLDVTAALLAPDPLVAGLRRIPGLAAHLDRWSEATGAPLGLHDPLTLLALMGETVTVGRRALAVSVEGRLVESATDGVEHDVVVGADHGAALGRIEALVMEWGD